MQSEPRKYPTACDRQRMKGRARCRKNLAESRHFSTGLKSNKLFNGFSCCSAFFCSWKRISCDSVDNVMLPHQLHGMQLIDPYTRYTLCKHWSRVHWTDRQLTLSAHKEENKLTADNESRNGHKLSHLNFPFQWLCSTRTHTHRILFGSNAS